MGQEPVAPLETPSAYAPRLDFIAACSGQEPFPGYVITPEDRKRMDVKGVRTASFTDFVRHYLAPALNESKQDNFVLVLDKSPIHNTDKIKEALDKAGCDKVARILVLPKETAKKVSPLDNALFHDWKENIRKKKGLKKIGVDELEDLMETEWAALKPAKLASHFHKSKLFSKDISDSDLAQLK